MKFKARSNKLLALAAVFAKIFSTKNGKKYIATSFQLNPIENFAPHLGHDLLFAIEFASLESKPIL
ncbi:hypothetical protein Mag101_11880 [Microbulbifer agarilyticus]|uniref:Uncharacterized protein n=1 Tax=Microbulbifer agarilyticus TaxID=260552 RepID=A0A1Q2M7Q3_9GAMM|nr:hypothetical protein Mag101_11880 [Microbulbifer agarilyticus]